MWFYEDVKFAIIAWTIIVAAIFFLLGIITPALFWKCEKYEEVYYMNDFWGEARLGYDYKIAKDMANGRQLTLRRQCAD